MIEAVKAATVEAIAFIKSDTGKAVEIYRDMNKDKMSSDELLDLLKQPHMMDFIAAPQGTMKLAAHLHKTGTLRRMPAAWTDYYLPVAHDLPGN